jgi:hypothetical protein
MARVLRCLGVLAFLLVPVALRLGHPGDGFDGHLGSDPAWMPFAVIGLVLAGISLLIASAIVGLDHSR